MPAKTMKLLLVSMAAASIVACGQSDEESGSQTFNEAPTGADVASESTSVDAESCKAEGKIFIEHAEQNQCVTEDRAMVICPTLMGTEFNGVDCGTGEDMPAEGEVQKPYVVVVPESSSTEMDAGEMPEEMMETPEDSGGATVEEEVAAGPAADADSEVMPEPEVMTEPEVPAEGPSSDMAMEEVPAPEEMPMEDMPEEMDEQEMADDEAMEAESEEGEVFADTEEDVLADSEEEMLEEEESSMVELTAEEMQMVDARRAELMTLNNELINSSLVSGFLMVSVGEMIDGRSQLSALGIQVLLGIGGSLDMASGEGFVLDFEGSWQRLGEKQVETPVGSQTLTMDAICITPACDEIGLKVAVGALATGGLLARGMVDADVVEFELVKLDGQALPRE